MAHNMVEGPRNWIKCLGMKARLVCAAVVTGNVGSWLHVVGQAPDIGVTVSGKTITANAGATVGNVLGELVRNGYISPEDSKMFAQCGADLALQLGKFNGTLPAGMSVTDIKFLEGLDNMTLPISCLPHPSLAENLFVYGELAFLGVVGAGVLYLAGCMVRMGRDRPVSNEARRHELWSSAASPEHATLPEPRPGSIAGTIIVTVAVDENGSTQEVTRVCDELAYRRAQREEFEQEARDAEMMANIAGNKMREAFYGHFNGISGIDVSSFIDLLRELARGGNQSPFLPTFPSQGSESDNVSGGELSSHTPRRSGGGGPRRQDPPSPYVVQEVIKGGNGMPSWWLALSGKEHHD